jgi:hypothetical protein
LIPLVDVSLGVCLLAVIAVAAVRPRVSTSRPRRLVGWALVAVPLPLAVALHVFLRPPSALDQIAFIVGIVAFAAGAILVLAYEDEDERSDSLEDPDPAPWWPEFEREFRAYARRSERRRVRA